jgi:hypothetical protein
MFGAIIKKNHVPEVESDRTLPGVVRAGKNTGNAVKATF